MLRRKYFRVLATLVAFLLIVHSATEAFFSFRESKSHVAEVQLAAARVAATKIESFLDSIERGLKDTAELPWTSGGLDKNDHQVEFLRLLKITPAILELKHLDENGVERLFISRIHFTRKAVNEPQIQLEGKPRRVGYSATYIREDGEPYVSLTVPGRTRADGVTIAEINLKFIADVVGSMQIGDAGKAFVIDSGNLVVAHPNLSLVLRHIDLSTHPAVQLLRASDASSNSPTSDSMRRSPDKSAPRSRLKFHDGIGIEGGHVISSAVPIGATGWWVFVEQPYAEVLLPVFDALYRTIAILALGLGIAFLASYVLARRFTAPILKVRDGAARIGAGNLDARILVATGDEIEGLADEFNLMAGKLKLSYDGLEQKVSQKTAQLELANKHKSEFLANMSHELRTPLNAVIGFSDVLREQYFGQLNPKQKEYVKDINESGQHLLSLINDILDLSKIEAGQMDLDVTEFSVPLAIDTAMVLVRERALRHSLQLSAEIAPEVTKVIADQRKFKQILINLLTNAVKFSHPGGWVLVVAKRDTNGLMVTVKDSGIGIAAENHAAVFDAFRQISSSGAGRLEGTGLGLSLVRRMVELHGGRIWVESALGEGAAFTFTLPDGLLVAAAEGAATPH